MSDQLLRRPRIRARICDQIISPILHNAAPSTEPKQLVLLVGLSGAGKSTFRREHPTLKDMVCIETDALHALLNRHIRPLRDDGTVDGHAYWARQFLTRWVRAQLTTELMARDTSFVIDACNLERKGRLGITRPAHKLGYETTIIWIHAHELVHYDRLRAADDTRQAEGLPRTWYRLVEQIQRLRFEPPSADEACRILTHFGQAPIASLSL